MDNTTFTTVTLSWLAPNVSSGIVIEYQVEYRKSGNSSFSQLLTSKNNLTLTGLSPNIEYQFRVATVTAVGCGTYTNFINYSTLGGFTMMITCCNYNVIMYMYLYSVDFFNTLKNRNKLIYSN